MKKSSKVLWIALIVVVSLVVTAFSAMASEPAYAESGVANKTFAAADVTMVYGAETEETPEEFLHNAILASEADGGKVVDIVLEASMTFTTNSTIGTPGATHNGQVNIYSVTEGDAAPTLGITLNKTVKLNVYGNVSFDNIVLLRETSTGSFSEGGVFNFVEGMGTFGHDETSEGAADWGTLVCSTDSKSVIHLSGHVTVYTGSYWTISGNFYATNTTVDNVYLKIAGNATVQDLYAGKHNYTSSTPNEITGTTTMQILDAASVTSLMVGGNRNTGSAVSVPAANILIDTTGLMQATYLGCYVNNSGTNYNNSPINVTIKNGNFVGSVYAHRSTAGTASNMNITVTFEGGVYTGAVMLGNTATSGVNSIGMNGSIVANFNGGDFNNNVTLGSNFNWGGSTGEAGADHYLLDGVNRTITFNDGEFNNIYGLWMGKASEGKKNIAYGTTTINLNGGTFAGEFFAGGNVDTDASGTFKNGNKTYKVIVNVNPGFNFNNTKQGFYGGVKNTKVGTFNFNGEIEINFNGGTFPAASTTADRYYVCGGSELGIAGAVHSGNTTLNFNGGTFACYNMQGGSNIYAAATHSGNINVNISAIDVTPAFYASSALRAANATHSGATTVVLQGQTGKLIKFASHIAAGSNISATNSLHSGSTKLYLKDVSTTTVASAGITQTISLGGELFAGSQMSYGTMTGDTELIIQRSYIVKTRAGFGGCRMDNSAPVFSGTSKTTIDANTYLEYDEETQQYVEKTGSGWNYIKGFIYGGTYLNGYMTGASTDKSYVKQTGPSEVVVIGPETAGDDIKSRLTFETTATTKLTTAHAIVGGSYYAHARLKAAPSAASSVTLKNNINYVGVAPDVFGGSYFNMASQFESTSIIPTTQVIVETEYDGKVIAAHFSAIDSSGSSRTYNVNSAVILKNGGKVNNKIILGSMANGSGTSLNNTNGTSLLEVYSDSIADNDKIDVQFQTGTKGKTGVKFIGGFNDSKSDNDSNFTVYLKTKLDFLDAVQVAGSSLTVYLYTESEGTITTTTNRGYTSIIERMADTKVVKFIDSASTRYKYNEIVVDPSMTFADLLATSGLNIHTNYHFWLTGTDYDYVNAYADIIRFDAASTSPNAYKFYAVNADGSRGEELTTIPTDPSVKVIIQSGIRYSHPSQLYHVFGISKKSMELTSNLTMLYKIDKAAAEAAGYTVEYIKVDFCGVVDTIYPEAELDDGRYVFKFKNISPAGMNDDMTVTVYGKYNGEDVSSVPTVYGPREYLYTLMKVAKQDSNSALCTLVADIINYGSAAQTYVDRNATELLNKKLLKTNDKNYATADVGTLTSVKDVNYVEVANATATIAPSLTLGSALQIRYRLTLPEDITNLTVKVVNGEFENVFNYESFVATENANEYYLYVDYLNADQVSEEVLVTVYDGETAISNTCRYSIESYAKLAADTTAEEYATLRALTDAMIKYGKAAIAYVATLTA